MTDSDQQPPTVPGNQYWPPQPAVPPARQKSRLPWLIIGGLVAVLALGIGIGVAVNGGDRPAPSKPTSADQEQVQGVEGEPTEDPTTPAPSATPKTSDIALTPKITDKQCFGSAGCSVDFKIEMDYLGPLLSEDDTWEVTYEVTGVEDGPMIGTLELTGTTFTSSEESVSTTSSKKKIIIKVTDVDKVGI